MKRRALEQEHVRFAISVLRNAGAKGVEIEDLMLGRHSEACACWDCVLRLQNSVKRHRVRMVTRARWERFRKRHIEVFNAHHSRFSHDGFACTPCGVG